MAWSHPYLSLLTSAVTLYKEAKKAMIPRLRFLLPPLATSWQRPRRLAKLSQKI